MACVDISTLFRNIPRAPTSLPPSLLTPALGALPCRFKRTVNIFQPNTEEGLAKFQEEIDAIHTAFKVHVAGLVS